MSLFTRNFRLWWQPPRKVGTGPDERQVTFLELFYDLVYVVLIAELAHALATHLGWAGLGGFAFLFIIVWWAWFNGTSYHDLHGNNDIRTRVFTFLQMLSVIAMAVFAHDALGETSVGFAWSYAGFQLILTYMWWRTGVHDPDHRPLSRPYTISFLLTTLLFVVSTFLAAPVRFYLWGAALVISLIMPLSTFLLGKRNPEVQAQIDLVTAVSPSMVERFGLLSIIVLGEVIVGVVGGVTAHHHLDWVISVTGALGALIAIGLWWVYFDYVSHHLPRPGAVFVSLWFYLHLPLTMGIASVGAAVLNVVEHASEPLHPEVQWLLVGAIAVSLLSIAILDRTIQIAPEHHQIHRAGRRVMVAAAVLIGLLGLARLEVIPMLGILVLLMLAPIYTGLRRWLAVTEVEC
jgi:low temperature requirement protein LtrA